MRRGRISRARAAAVAVGFAALMTLGLAGTAGGAAAAAHPGGDPVYTSSQAGYVTGGGWYFRFISTTVTVAPAPSAVFNLSLAEVVLGSTAGPPVTLAVPAGGGPGSISYSWKSGTLWNTGRLTKLSPAPGDVLTLNIYYNQHGQDFLTAIDATQHTSQTVVVDVVPVIYNAAEAAAVVNNATVVPPTSDTRLWEFTGTLVTTYAGLHGTLLGPWATYQVIDTQAGTVSSPVVASAPVLWDNGQNFGSWLRATA